MTTLVKSNTVTVNNLWKSLSYIRLNRRDTELLDMTRDSSFSYTSLRDIVSSSLPTASSKQWNNQLTSYQSLPSIRHVHMKNPLVEKAARAYLVTANRTHQAHNAAGLSSSSFSFFLKIVRIIPFLGTHTSFFSLFGDASAWFKQLTIKMYGAGTNYIEI